MKVKPDYQHVGEEVSRTKSRNHSSPICYPYLGSFFFMKSTKKMIGTWPDIRGSNSKHKSLIKNYNNTFESLIKIFLNILFGSIIQAQYLLSFLALGTFVIIIQYKEHIMTLFTKVHKRCPPRFFKLDPVCHKDTIILCVWQEVWEYLCIARQCLIWNYAEYM